MAKEFSESHPVYNRVGYIVYQTQSVKSILSSLLLESNLVVNAGYEDEKSGSDAEKTGFETERNCAKRVSQLFGAADKPRRALFIQRLAADLKIEKRLVSAIETVVDDYLYVTENLVVQSRVPVFDDLVDEELIDRLDVIAERVIALVFDLRGLLINRQLSKDADLEMCRQKDALIVAG